MKIVPGKNLNDVRRVTILNSVGLIVLGVAFIIASVV